MPLVSERAFAIPAYVRPELGWQETILLANPALGATATRVIPGLAFEFVLAFRCIIVAGATAANRLASLQALDGDNKVTAEVFANDIQTAGQSITYSWLANVGTGRTTPSIRTYEMPAPPVVFAPGTKLKLACVNIQGDDQISGIAMTLLRIPTGPGEHVETPLDVLDLGILGSTPTVPLGAPPPPPSSSPSGPSAPAPSAPSSPYAPYTTPPAGPTEPLVVPIPAPATISTGTEPPVPV